MAQKSTKDLTLLSNKQVVQRQLLLFVKKLLHDFEEVAAEDGKWVLIFIEELAQLIHQEILFRVGFLLHFWFWRYFRCFSRSGNIHILAALSGSAILWLSVSLLDVLLKTNRSWSLL